MLPAKQQPQDSGKVYIAEAERYFVGGQAARFRHAFNEPFAEEIEDQHDPEPGCAAQKCESNSVQENADPQPQNGTHNTDRMKDQPMLQVNHQDDRQVNQQDECQREAERLARENPDQDRRHRHRGLDNQRPQVASFSAVRAVAEEQVVRPFELCLTYRANWRAEFTAEGQYIRQGINQPAGKPT